MAAAPPATKWLTTVASALGVTLLFAAFWLAREMGALMNALFVFIAAAACSAVVRTLIAALRGKLSFEAYRTPRAHLPQLSAAALRVIAWPSFALAVHVAVVVAQFSPRELHLLRSILFGCALLLVLCSLVPRRVRAAPSDVLFVGLLALVLLDLWRGLAAPDAGTAVAIESPFQRPVLVFQGGGSPLFNHHVPIVPQAQALDLLPLSPAGTIATGDPKQLGSYPCFGETIIAPAGGRVAHVETGRPDMPIGERDRDHLVGNNISIEIQPDRYVLLGHLQAGSVQVSEGDRVLAGRPIARCGNSGNTSMPHLHLQIQNRAVLSNEDAELRTYPITFVRAARTREGQRQQSPFFVRRNDVIVPLD